MFTSTLTPAIALTLALTAGACTTPDVGASGADPVTTVAAETVDDATLTAATSSQPVSLSDALDAYPVADLTEEEIAGLVYMRGGEARLRRLRHPVRPVGTERVQQYLAGRDHSPGMGGRTPRSLRHR
ncbi:MAG: hypothetical protein R2710_04445 [Acidimicrobiales bacterium]